MYFQLRVAFNEAAGRFGSCTEMSAKGIVLALELQRADGIRVRFASLNGSSRKAGVHRETQ
eukprot:468112-Lingulodinium_polyedra.AAC.1